ncbi:MAG: AAA family ATPase [Rikenellaceae bacterium]
MVDINLKEPPLVDVNVKVNICSSGKKTVEIDECLLKGQTKKRFCIPIKSLTAQDNYFHIEGPKKMITTRSISIVEPQENVKNEIELIGFSLTRVNSDDIMLGMDGYVARPDQIVYDINNLSGIFLMAVFKNISNAYIDYQFTLVIVDSNGEYVYENETSGCLVRDEDLNFWCEIKEEIWKKGTYQILIYHCDQLIAKTAVTIGERDLQCSKLLSLVQQGLSGMKMTTLNSYMGSENMKRLNGMIGLTEVKKQLSKLIARTSMDKLRKEQNLPLSSQQLHLAFLGNPGTGKTTVAKLLGQIYKEIGVLSSGDVLVRDRSTLSGQNWGSEGELVNQAIEQSAGGVLFIDEAYDIVTEHRNDPGKLIISTLLGEMSNESKRDWMVIFAGYTQQMEKFLSKNPGLRSRLKVIHFKDYNVEELMQVADIWLEKNCYNFTDEARRYFESVVANAYALRDENFGNARYVINLLEAEVQPAMAERIMSQESFSVSLDMLTTIEAIEIPNYYAEQENAVKAIEKLNSMVGLGELKKKISSHLSYIRFVRARRDNSINTSIPPLHMIFTGNPGTGKTSVADYLGDIYHSMGILSVGNVIKVSRADMIGSVIGETEEKMKNLIATAQGNILFIDEAYTLFNVSERDFGKIAIETLLDTLGKESTNMIVIMAGYPKEMEQLINLNPGIRGRFPYKFHFEDYNENELLEIADIVVQNNNLTMTSAAKDAIKAIIRKECKTKDSNFSKKS